MQLSQGHLKLLETCPRKFQYLYLEQLAAPIAAEQIGPMTWGSRFHQLLQQRELNLPIAPLVEADLQLAQAFHAFTATVPDIATPIVPEPGLRESEHVRTIGVQGHSLMVIYDLLIADTDQAHILDWKTYRHPPSHQSLQQDWQTRLYLWVLAKTSTYAADRLSMTYWFTGGGKGSEKKAVRSEEKATPIGEADQLAAPTPTSVTIAYSDAQHHATTQALMHCLGRLSHWLDRYQAGEDFPQVAESQNLCRHCNFVTRCQREQHTYPLVLDLDAIAEVPL
ncbi:PD-(D/E)XK nuclease family protein [Trichothermofontia sp.]